VVAGCALALVLGGSGAGAQTFKVIYDFKGGSDGGQPFAGLISDAQGNLYGTTARGGNAACGGCGTVFRIAPDGTETALYAFAGGSDGAYPGAPLVRDAQGNLFGTTVQGGRDCRGVKSGGCGTVFRLTPDGQETVLHAFKSSEGSLPYSSLVLDANGNLYGTTYQGGDFFYCYRGCGTVFEVKPGGGEKTLYTFHNNSSDGGFPHAGLIDDAEGNLYGTTSQGGAALCGTVFRLSPDGTETVLLNVGQGAPGDGCNPMARLFADSRRNLFGTTEYGGYEGNGACGGYYPYGCGIVFRLSPNGVDKVLHAFRAKDGDNPTAGVVVDAQGNVYGTTTIEGDSLAGTVFKLSGKKETVLHMFTGGPDGAFPAGDLLMDGQGNLFGTTAGGGDPSCSCGSVFEITP
jgi:uncharacterized repeat protein (TIGR03803 family)